MSVNIEDYKPGTVYELYENDSQEYIIIDTIEEKENLFFFTAPVIGTKKDLKAYYDKTFLIKVKKETGDLEIEKDKEVVKRIWEMSSQKLK